MVRRGRPSASTVVLVFAMVAASSASSASAQDALPLCAPLPEALPPGLMVEVVERGATPGMRRRAIVTRGTPCPDVESHARSLDRTSGSTRACVSVDDVAAEQLWRRLRLLRVERIARQRIAASPHRGGRSLRVAWRGGACELSDMGDVAVTSASRPAFDLVVAAAEAALALGSPAVGTCVAEASPPPFLQAYLQARPGTRHRVRADWSDAQRTWAPSPALVSMRHRDDHIEWVNLGELGLRDDGPRAGYVLTITVLESDLLGLPPGPRGERMFRATHRVRIDSLCAPDAAH